LGAHGPTKTGWPTDYRERFWEVYPHKVGKPVALKSLDRIAKQGRTPFAELMAGLERYVSTKPPDRDWCNPATWLNQERWADEPAAVTHFPKTQGARDVPTSQNLVHAARNLGDRIAAAQRGEPLFSIGGDEGSGNPVRMLPDGRFGGA